MHEKVIVAIMAPFQMVINGVGQGTKHLASSYMFLVNQKKEVRALQKKLSAWRQDSIVSQELFLENRRLKKMLSIDVAQAYRRVIATRIAHGSSRFEKTIRIQKGKLHDIQEGQAVLNSDGIVGQVIKVYWGHSDVLLLTDPSSSIDVIIQRSRENAMLKGHEKDRLAFEYLDKAADINEGDIVVSSGLDGIYPKGFSVGQVNAIGEKTRSLFLQAGVTPFVNFNQIEEVVVLIPTDSGKPVL